MQKDFHYYATYCAAYLAGYTHEESLTIAYSANFVDHCTRSLLAKIGASLHAATTQLTLEMADAKTDKVGIHDITRIWASFHFLPGDLYAEIKAGRRYKEKYHLICNPNSDLIVETVTLAKENSLQAVGLAMHVLADTWAHRYFAGTPSLVINNTTRYFYELLPDGEQRKISFRVKGTDAPEESKYIATPYQPSEKSIMNLGHGRAGHLPDYSYIRYKYLPAWGNYEEIIKDNPSDYYDAFGQMVYALKCIRGNTDFQKNTYDTESVAPWEKEIREILINRTIDNCEAWEGFAEKLSGEKIEPFDIDRYQKEYMDAPKAEKETTFLGAFIHAAMAQKSMVTNRIYRSGNTLAGISVEQKGKYVKGIRDFKLLMTEKKGADENDEDLTY